MKYLVPIYLVLLSIYSRGCSNQVQQNESLALPKDQKTPVEFADGSIQTTNGINFSRDGSRLYISNPVEKRFRNGRALAGILQYDYQNGQWYGPKLVEFEYEIDAYHPVLSFDNSTLFFNSRSHPDTINKSIPHNIWYARKSEDSWSRPKMVEGINSDAYDSYPSLAKNNNLYFNSDRPGGFGGMDIYLSNYENGIYQSPINLVNLNSEDVENDLVVDPHERFIIFNRYISSTEKLDLYISFRESDTWGGPKKLDKINTPDKWELTPTLSPDGEYFFYELNGKIMQISTDELLRDI